MTVCAFEWRLGQIEEQHLGASIRAKLDSCFVFEARPVPGRERYVVQRDGATRHMDVGAPAAG
jgi:hypothetical protein